MNDFQNRQPKGVPTGGQFAASARAESGLHLTDDIPHGPDLSSWTPVEVDTELARLYAEHGAAMQRYMREMDYVTRQVARSLGRRGYDARANRQEVEEAIAALRAQQAAGETVHYNDGVMLREYDKAQEHLAAAQSAEQAMEPLNEEFSRRGGWTRAFLVTNVNGHVHSSMDCSTCFRPGWDNSGNWREGTRYEWRTELSGKTEEDVVNAAKARACTTCYPSAPVEVLNQPSTMFTAEEIDKQKAREEREKAKQARDAAKIEKGLTTDGSEFRVGWTEERGGHERNADGQTIYVVKPRPERQSFKTEKAAVQWLVQDLAWNKDRPDTMAARQEAYDAVIEAVARKHGKSVDEVRAEIDQKVTAKRKRDGYTD